MNKRKGNRGKSRGLTAERSRRARAGKGTATENAPFHSADGAIYLPIRTATVEIDGDRHECPVSDVHIRMEDAHALWHEALDAYDDPEQFRRRVNSLLQELRNVTFVLQNLKGSLATLVDFEEWYEGWRKRMKADRVVSWVVEARNRVTKRKGLDMASWTDVKVIADYDRDNVFTLTTRPVASDETDIVHVPLVPSAPLNAYKSYLSGLPADLFRHGYLERSRYWADSELPDVELLEACAHAFGTYQLLLADLHEKLQRESGPAVRLPDGIALMPARVADGRLACMFAPLESRTSRLGMVDDRSDVGGRRWTVETDEDRARAAMRGYGIESLPKVENGDFLGSLEAFMDSARRMLVADKTHGWIILLFREGRPVNAELIDARDQADKISVMRDLARTVKLSRVDAVIQIGDMWWAPLSQRPEEMRLRPSERSDRKEGLVVTAELSTGETRSLHSLYRREEGTGAIVFEGESFESREPHQSLSPIREVWRDNFFGRFQS